MKNMSFIAFLLSHTKKEIIDYLSEKETRNLPENLSQKAKYLISQDGKKKEDIFRETGLSRDYLYKVLRGEKKIRERDYILAICFAAHLDLFDAGLMLCMYDLGKLQLSNERDVLLIYALNSKTGLEETNNLLLSAGFHKIRTSPKDDINDTSPVRFEDIEITKLDIGFEKNNWVSVSARAIAKEDISLEYSTNNGKQKCICSKNNVRAKVYKYLFEGMVWNETAKRMRVECTNENTMIHQICSDNEQKIIAETKRGEKYYQIVRYADGHMIYSASICDALPYLLVQAKDDMSAIYKVLCGTIEKPDFLIYGGDLEELEHAEDIDVAVFLRMRREIREWRYRAAQDSVSKEGAYKCV